MRRILAIIATVCLILAQIPASAEGTVWRLVTEEGAVLTHVCYEPEQGDQYVAADNTLYEVASVSGETATVRVIGMFELPDVSWLSSEEALAVSAAGAERLIALYCTHSDESYEPTDGVYSDEQRGSIYKVASALGAALEERGITAEVSDELHHPHDAGAYRRSRQTAVQLLKSRPDALFDIHRDGIPDPDEYAVTIGGTEMSKIRLLVGRGNQNMEVNKKLAARIKAIADKVYPGLIKDIYMGKGTYNQDLSPQSLLFECGTYTTPREQVEKSLPLLAHVVSRALYGGVVGSAGTSDAGSGNAKSGGVTQGEPDPVPAEESGAGSGMAWIVGVFVVGIIVFAVVQTGSLSGAGKKIGRNMSEMTGGLIGKKPEDKDEG